MKTYYLAELPKRFLNAKSDTIDILTEVDPFTYTGDTPVAYFECKYSINSEIHHKDECLYVCVQVLPVDGEMDKYPFSEMTDDEIEEMLEHYGDFYFSQAVPSNVTINKRGLATFSHSGLQYSSDFK